jgi:hypothetical protein
MALAAMISVISLGAIGCGGDEDDADADVTQPPADTTPPDAGGDGAPLPVDDGGDIDFAVEKQAILNVWAEFMQLYNDRKLADIKNLWTNQQSDFLFINISDNERIDAEGAKKVQDTLVFLTKGHNSTLNDKWTGGNMTQVWIRKKGGRLEGSAHGPNALRGGETWTYFQNVRGKWLINKVEAIETRNLVRHTKIEIHEREFATGVGFFDDPKYLIQ